jgi:hypothetical protein
MEDISSLLQLVKQLLRDYLVLVELRVRDFRALGFMMGLTIAGGRVVLQLGDRCCRRVGNLVSAGRSRGIRLSLVSVLVCE